MTFREVKYGCCVSQRILTMFVGVAALCYQQEEIDLETLARRRKRKRVELLIKILRNNDVHFDRLTVQQTASHHGFIPRTSRGIRLALNSFFTNFFLSKAFMIFVSSF